MKDSDSFKFIKEMFPEVDEKIIVRLLESTQNNVDLAVTKLIDGTYKGIQFNVKDLVRTTVKQPLYKKELYFPEIINDFGSIKEEIDVEANRNEIKKLHENILQTKSRIVKNKLANEYYRERIDEIKEEINKINKETTLSIIKKSFKTPEIIDLHGLYTLDAIKFVDDHINTHNPPFLRLITGSDDSSRSLRPSLIKYLKEKKFEVTCEGPSLIAKKIIQ